MGKLHVENVPASNALRNNKTFRDVKLKEGFAFGNHSSFILLHASKTNYRQNATKATYINRITSQVKSTIYYKMKVFYFSLKKSYKAS
jgi:hypothetical protein